MLPYFVVMKEQKERESHLKPSELIYFAEKSRSSSARGSFVNYSYVSDIGALLRFRTCPADEEVFLLTAEALYVRQLATLGTPGHDLRYPNHTLQCFDISADGKFLAIACLNDRKKCPFVRVINR